MKKISSFLLFVLFLSGCYQDLGNYEYKLDSMNEITSATFTPSVANDIIEVQQALDENDRLRRVDVVVDQTLADSLEDLEFYWFRTFVDEDGKPVQDTIRTKGYLEFYLPVGKAMEYNIFLQIYDRTTDLSHYSGFAIKTRPVFKNSLFVMHGSEGNRKIGNIEVIGNETKIYTDVKTVTINYFEYQALKVNPSLSNDLTTALQDKFLKLTKLEQVEMDGDLEISGAVTGYDVKATAITANEQAAQNRLTVTVKISFTNRKYPEDDFPDKSFSAYADFDAMQPLDAVEASLCEEIIEQLCDDMFNATVANW